MPPAADILPRPLRVPGGGFRNPGGHEDRSWLDVLRWKLGPRREEMPPAREGIPLAAATPASPASPRQTPPAPARGLAATWVGHSTFLVRTPSLNLLTDPVWSARIGPAGVPGIRRARPPGLDFDALPRIDAILLSHDHYDHCDLPTLRRLARAHPQARLFCPLGHDQLAARAGFAAGRVRCLDWWETHELAPGATLTATPARHWSNRLSGARNGRLWCGWHLATREDGALFFAGDTAWDEAMFPAIRRQLGAPDLALIPIGAYAPRWFMRGQHCDPEEALRIHLVIGARRSVGMHWGTFALTDEPLEEPPLRLQEAIQQELSTASQAFEVMAIGETIQPHLTRD